MQNLIKENIYGHRKRLEWIIKKLELSDYIFEFGCGTGFMITIPLLKLGYNVYGLDDDEKSISLGRDILAQQGLDKKRIICSTLNEIDRQADVIIASEVLEHIPNAQLPEVLQNLRANLKVGGKLLITVPNGYGWFEAENFIWQKFLLGRFLEVFRILPIFNMLKQTLLGKDIEPLYPSTLSSSPHVQRFIIGRITHMLAECGFDVEDVDGSVLCCGPFTNMLFTGITFVMKLNTWLGSRFVRISSSFYIAAKKREL